MNLANALMRQMKKMKSCCYVLPLLMVMLPSLSSAVTITVASSPGSTTAIRDANGTNLRNEITNAKLRAGPTTLRLRKGHEFMGPITLRYKSLDDAYTIIESTGISDGTLPSSGVRVGPSNAANMAKILAPAGGGTFAIKTENGVGLPGTHHYVLRGLEVTKADNAHTYMLCEIGQDGSAPVGVDPQDTLQEVPHHIEIDQCYMHAYDNTTELSKHIFLNAGHSKISNCYFSDAKTLASTGESQAIGVCNGTGPHWIVNNYLQAATENFMSGGGGVKLPDTAGNPNIPSDVTFKRNYCPKDLAWLPDIDPATGYPNWTSSSADKWLVKNLFEIKFGRRFDVQGNIFENTWGQYAGQEFAIAIKNVTNSTSVSANECLTHDILFKYNKVLHAAGAIATEGRDYNRNFTPELRRLTIEHNVFEDITASMTVSGPGWGYVNPSLRGSFHYASHGGFDVRVQHNTCFNNGPLVFFALNSNYYALVNYALRNNVVQGQGTNQYGQNATIRGNTTTTGDTFGTAAINLYTDPGLSFVHNAIKTNNTSGITGAHLSDNWWPTAWTAGSILVNHPSNYTVVNPSVYYTNAAPGDGKPIGADMYTSTTDIHSVATQTANCTTGNWADTDIVLYAKDAPVKTSHWTVVADPLVAGESYLSESNTGASQTTPLASPTSYFEMSFTAQANKPYHLWIRGRAPSNQTASDSVWVQFTNTLDAVGGTSAYRIGTTSAMEWRLQNGTSDTISGWGWRDTKVAGGAAEKQVIFATTGTQTIRIQRFEDGPQFDQIVLSPNTYLGPGPVDANPEITGKAQFNPGYEDNDTTILMATSVGAPPPPPPVVPAYDGFNYTVPGNLNTQNGGTGFGNAWTTTGQANPALASGSLTYSDGTNSLVTAGNKVQPAVSSQSSRNFTNVITTANTTQWVAFRINQTDTGALPSNHAGFGLFSGTGATGTEIFLGKPGGSTNYGMYHSTGPMTVQKSGAVTTSDRDALLVYKLVFTSSHVTISMWVDPVMNEASLGAAHATLTQTHSTNIASMLVSTGTNASNFQLDEFRIGPTFADAVPVTTAAASASDGFNYTVPGNLNGQTGGTGFGSNAWAAVTGNPALASGSLTYSDGTYSLVTSGNKVQPAVSNRSTRNFGSAITTNGLVKWISFRINQTDTGALPTNHAGFGVYTDLAGGGTETFLGKPGSATNYGISHSGTWAQKSGSVTTADRNAFLVYKLDFTTAGSVTISMWINRPLNEASLGTPDCTLTKAHTPTSLQSMLVSTGTNAVNFQLDEFRIGNSFDSVTPKQ